MLKRYRPTVEDEPAPPTNGNVNGSVKGKGKAASVAEEIDEDDTGYAGRGFSMCFKLWIPTDK